ncbi:MAG: DUF5686 family protein, partial [Fidelibacterota bacterium]
MLINRKKQLLILFGLYAIGFGQTIHGRVVDSITQVPLGNCNISIQGTTRGTASNSEGFYSLRLPSGTYVLKFEYLGYNSFIKTIQLDKEPVNLTVSLVPSMIQLEPITVFSDEKSAVELLILKASRIKGKSQFIKNYVCHSYTKTSYRSALDPNSFGGILETYSELYYNSPDTWHEELLSQRQTSNFPQSVNFVSGNTFLDVNADRIEIGGNTLIGPTAPDAIEHYTFSIQDTLFQDNNRIFKIHFTPKNNNQPAMAGELYLADKYFLINHIDADLNSFCNYDLFENIHILQKYKALNDSIYVPNYSLRECDFALEFPGAPKIRTVKENYRENYQVNIPQNQISPIENTVVISQNIPFKSIPMLIPPLTIEEEMAYLQIDSLVTHNYRMKILTRIFKFVDLYSKFNSKPVGDISDFIRFNRVEGLFAGLAYNSKNRWESSMLKVGAGYGISDERFKYFVINSMAYQISIFRIQAALHSYDRIATIESQDDIPLLANSMNSLLRNFDYYDYYFVKGNRLNFQLN